MNVVTRFINTLKKLPSNMIVKIIGNGRESNNPSRGLTPEKLARILLEADNGNILEQMELFEEMEEKDPHLFSQLQTRKNAVVGLDYEIIPASESEFDIQVADFIKEVFDEFEDFEDVLMDLLDAIGKGISFVEIIWKYENGKMLVDKFKTIQQKHFYWDEKDVLKLVTEENPQGEELAKYKFITHKYKAKSGHPARAGILRIISYMYLFKNYTMKDWVTFCEVYGMPIRIGTYDPSASDDDKADLLNALLSLGSDSAGIHPTNTDIKVIESNKQSSAQIYESLARFCDEQMSKAILGQTLTSDSGGSHAQSKTHNEVRHDLTVADCKALAKTIRRDLIKPLVEINFGIDTKVPKLKFDCDESEDLEMWVNIYKALINDLGLKIPEEHLHKVFGVPKAVEESPVNDVQIIKNKSDIEVTNSILDDITTVSTQLGESVFNSVFKVLKSRMDSAESLEELSSLISDADEVTKILKEMGNSDLGQLLENTMLFSHLQGWMHGRAVDEINDQTVVIKDE